jgi:hypothetical protein
LTGGDGGCSEVVAAALSMRASSMRAISASLGWVSHAAWSLVCRKSLESLDMSESSPVGMACRPECPLSVELWFEIADAGLRSCWSRACRVSEGSGTEPRPKSFSCLPALCGVSLAVQERPRPLILSISAERFVNPDDYTLKRKRFRSSFEIPLEVIARRSLSSCSQGLGTIFLT